MTDQLRRLAVPAYVLICLLLGGSSTQGVWGNMVLQLLAISLIAAAALARPIDNATAPSRLLMLLVCAALVVTGLQLVPLPPSLWTSLPGREWLARGYELLGLELPWLPISFAPYRTLATFLALLPALATLLATLRLRQNEIWLAAALLLGALAGVLLGAMQVGSGSPPQSPWFPYSVTNYGAVGFFANSNHMGTLLLVSIPFAIALLASGRSQSRERAPRSGMSAYSLAGLLVLIVGIALNRSLAALALAVPVLALSALLLPEGRKHRKLAAAVAAIGAVVCIAFFSGGSIADEIVGRDLVSFQSRAHMWRGTLELIGRTFPAGTGLGSFPLIYPLIEDPAMVGRTFVNHAHNDYLELLLETGLPGLILLVAFLGWWVIAAVRVWRSRLSSPFARAATIGSAAILAHSVVDYPLRTAAVAAVFALCLALMVARPVRSADEASALRATRHIRIG